MRASKIEKAVGINYDYILALKSTNGILSIDKIDISRNNSLIDELFEIYENPCRDVVEMYKIAMDSIQSTDCTFSFCLGNGYYDSYIDEIAFPKLDVKEYQKTISDRENHIANCYKKDYKEYADKLQYELDNFIKETKKDYLESLLPYIYSCDYDNTLLKRQVENNYLFFSSENHGRFSYETIVSNDLKILTRTNFCYGSSSYFHIIVKYKNVELLPFGEWVKYYYAGYNSIMRYTRSYNCDRYSWEYAMKFLESFVNKAIENPEDFVKNELLLEVDDLMAGLEGIFRMSIEEFEERLNVRHIEEDNCRYRGISSARHANERERKYYLIKGSESAMIFKMEKISGAIHFLRNLKSISVILPEVKNSISRIIELNNSIYPEVVESIPLINLEINNLIRKQGRIKYQYFNKCRQLNCLKNRLEFIKKKSINDGISGEQVEANFKATNPQYTELISETEELSQKIEKYSGIIRNRSELVNRLHEYRRLIERVVRK